MKIRNGFVSNSSSSSFVILCKDNTLSYDDLFERNMEVLSESYDLNDKEEKNYCEKRAAELSKKSKYILLKEHIEYGSGESTEIVIRKLIKNLNPNLKIECMWDD
jgi:hypothetical protein